VTRRTSSVLSSLQLRVLISAKPPLQKLIRFSDTSHCRPVVGIIEYASFMKVLFESRDRAPGSGSGDKAPGWETQTKPPEAELFILYFIEDVLLLK